MHGALAVAEARTFEKVYAERIDHLWSVAARGIARGVFSKGA
jgi:hypothetical protein